MTAIDILLLLKFIGKGTMHNFNKCFHFMHCTEFSQWLVSIRSPLPGNRDHCKTQKTYNTMILIHIISEPLHNRVSVYRVELILNKILV